MDDDDIIRFPQVLTRVQYAERLKELQDEFDDPPMADNNKERLNNAIVYVQDRKWSLGKAAKKAGVHKSSVYRYACVVTLFFFVFLPFRIPESPAARNTSAPRNNPYTLN